MGFSDMIQHFSRHIKSMQLRNAFENCYNSIYTFHPLSPVFVLYLHMRTGNNNLIFFGAVIKGLVCFISAYLLIFLILILNLFVFFYLARNKDIFKRDTNLKKIGLSW